MYVPYLSFSMRAMSCRKSPPSSGTGTAMPLVPEEDVMVSGKRGSRSLTRCMRVDWSTTLTVLAPGMELMQCNTTKTKPIQAAFGEFSASSCCS